MRFFEGIKKFGKKPNSTQQEASDRGEGKREEIDLARRRLLAGGAAVVGQSMTSVPAPALMSGTKLELAAMLAPRILQQVSQIESIAELGLYSLPQEDQNEKNLSLTVAQALKLGTPSGPVQKIDIHIMDNVGHVLDVLQRMPRMRVGDFKDPEVIKEALRFADAFPEAVPTTSSSGGRKIFDEELSQSVVKILGSVVSDLQKITGVSDKASTEEVWRIFHRKAVEMAGNVLDHPELLPEIKPSRLVGFFGHPDARQKVLGGLGRLLTAWRMPEGQSRDDETFKPLLAKLKAREKQDGEVRVKFRDELNWKDHEERMAFKRESELQRKAESEKIQRAEETKSERFNTDLEKRTPILCRVEYAEPFVASREAMIELKQNEKALGPWSFQIRPERYEGRGNFKGLTRMHIQHLRQMLVQARKLDNDDPSNVTVEASGRSVRITTTDEKFAAYLREHADYSAYIEVPNRLQMQVDDIARPEIKPTWQRKKKGPDIR